MIHFVIYSADNMTISRLLCENSAKENGAEVINGFHISEISQEFYDANKKTLQAERGLGYYLQKPYFVHKVMLNCADGDILIYCDAGANLIANVNHIISRMDQDIFLFTNGLQHRHWCKADILKAILHVDMIEYEYTQVQASLMFFRINDYTRNFIKEWLLFAQMPGLIDDSPSKLPNDLEFAENRYDQAILATLAYRDKIKLHWWPDQKWFVSQRYRWPEDTYPPMLIHHRKRNNEW